MTVYKRIQRNGMTLIELLCVMLLISMFTALIFPGIAALKRSLHKRKTIAATSSIASAVEQYRSLYGHWPLMRAETEDDIVYAPLSGEHQTDVPIGEHLDQRLLIGALTTNLVENPRNHLFIEINNNDLSDGYYVDPWGNPYIIFADNNSDGFLDITIKRDTRETLTLTTNESCMAFSWGDKPDKHISSTSTP